MQVTTNNVPRDVIYGFGLTEKQRAEFDYLDDIDSASFFAYKGQIYDLGEFTQVDSDLFAGWDGYSSDTYFSGVVVRYVQNFERVIVGQYFA